MTPERLAGLRTLAESLPPDTPVPVPSAWLLELLNGVVPGSHTPDLPPTDLTIPDLAKRFGRKNSTVREWVERGRFPGAYHFGREWRIPSAAVLDFETSARRPSADAKSRPTPRHARRGGNSTLGDWRKAS